MLEKNAEYTAVVEGMGGNGEGIVKTEGCAVFVPFALSDEKIRLKILKAKSNYAFGKLLSVESPSPYRCEPLCPVFTKCGGCDLQHVEYSEQLKLKAKFVSDCLKKTADIDIAVPAAVSSGERFRYRNKLQLPVRHTKRGNVVGFFRENSHDVVPIDDCLIQRQWAGKLISAIKKYIESVSCFDEETGRGNLKHVVARDVGGKLIIVLVITAEKAEKTDLFVSLLDERFNDYSLFINVNKLGNNVIFGDEFRLLKGSEKTSFIDGGITLSMGPQSFMQVNDDVRRLIYAEVSSLLKGAGSAVIDAYSGAGYLTAVIAKNCAHAYGIECVKEAVDCADELASKNGLSGKITNICGLCEEVIPRLIPKVSEKYERVSVVLDPPRKGCDEKVLSAVLAAKPENIVYISCNPATLARDLGLLTGRLKYFGRELKKTGSQNGIYNIDFVKPFDMFPNTRHVETLVCLKRSIEN